jgi:hypothetical protein
MRARVCETRRWRLRVLRDRGRGTAALYGNRGGLDVWDPGCRAGRGHAAAGLGCESEPGSSLWTSPIGGPRLTARERRERRGGPLGHAGREKKRKVGWAGPCRRKGREGAGQAGLGRVGKRKREREDGTGQEEKKRERKGNAFKCI